MAIKLDQRSRQKVLIFVALGVALATGLVLYFGFFKNKASTPSMEIAEGPGTEIFPESVTKVSPAIEEKLKKINLDFEFLNNKILSVLKIHGKIPVEKGSTGRDNPFIPY